MKVAITGASGLLGPQLVRSLRADGHEVVRLVRREATGPDEVRWDPSSGHVDVERLVGVEAGIHLAGAGIGDRPWTPAYRREVLESRRNGTRTFASALASLDPRPRVLLSMSGVGYYGNPGDRLVDESDPLGEGYIAEVTRVWETETAPAADAGIRVVTLRTGIVLSAQGGAFGRRLLPIFRLGLGGRLGSGRQYWSWISEPDYVRAVRFLLDRDDISGPVNVCAPAAVTNAELTSTLGRVLHRPTVFTVPGFALRLPLGDFARDILAGQRVMPRRLLDAGFTFEQPAFEPALRAALTAR